MSTLIEKRAALMAQLKEKQAGLKAGEISDDDATAIKQLLAGFNKGIFTYSAADNTAKVTFKYKLTENELTLYIDKGMISETWSAGKAIMNGILALVGEDNPEIAAILTAVIPQVDTMLEGFNKIEVGAKMTRK